MELNIKPIYILGIFFILTILLSSVSAFEFVEDYNLTGTDFAKDATGETAFKLGVPESSAFALMDDYSGEIKNDDGKGLLATYANGGELADDVSLICYLEDNTENKSIAVEFLSQMESEYQIESDDNGMLILKMTEDATSDSEDNSTADASEDLNDTADDNSSEAFEEIDSAQAESDEPQYAVVCSNDDNSALVVLFGDNLDLMKEMCNDTYFAFVS